MVSLHFSPLSLEDLGEIAAYIARDNPKRAKSFVDALIEVCHTLAEQPYMGAARPELGDRVRLHPHGHYHIFYRPLDTGVRIERVLHGARHIDADYL